MPEKINEGSVSLHVYKGEISKELPVFYNPDMKLNRDITIEVLKAVGRPLEVGLPLAGSGVRGIRILKEVPGMTVYMNDNNARAVELIQKNLELNSCSALVFEKEATDFLAERYYDYIDIDPFGSPNPFLDTACRRIRRKGILAVTATDTGCLCGTYPKTCLRKYWAKPLHNELMKEVGLRILIRKVQLVGMQYDKALIPIISYAKDHYFRVFFEVRKGKKKCDELILQHGYLILDTDGYRTGRDVFNSGNDYAGPMWMGSLATSFLSELQGEFLETLKEDYANDILFFHDVPTLCKEAGVRAIPFTVLFERIRKQGYRAKRTHFAKQGIRSDIPKKELIEILAEGPAD
ncbi:MAG: tRNA (guanine(26)-N(2))-dimethyltransferase [Candidatus Woesearchaeota archaeon]